MKHLCSLYPQERNTGPCGNCVKIKKLQDSITQLGVEMFRLLKPTQEELQGLSEDLYTNPQVYVSYLMPVDEPEITENMVDCPWVAEHIIEEREE